MREGCTKSKLVNKVWTHVNQASLSSLEATKDVESLIGTKSTNIQKFGCGWAGRPEAQWLEKNVEFYSASPDVQSPSSIIPSLRYFRLCRICATSRGSGRGHLSTLTTTNSLYSSSYPDSCFLGPVGTAQKEPNVSLHLIVRLNSPSGKHTGIRNRDLRRVLVARPLPNLERNRDRNGADGANDNGPKVRGALARRPLQVADGRGPEPGVDAGHCEGCGFELLASQSDGGSVVGWEGRFVHGRSRKSLRGRQWYGAERFRPVGFVRAAPRGFGDDSRWVGIGCRLNNGNSSPPRPGVLAGRTTATYPELSCETATTGGS